MTLFDRPLQTDWLVRLWLLALGLALLVLAPRYVTVGAPFSFSLLLGLLGGLLRVAFWAWVALVFLALLRMGWRSRNGSGSAWWRSSGRRGSSLWGSAGPAGSWQPTAGRVEPTWPSGPAETTWAHRTGGPEIALLSVSDRHVVEGQPVRVSWSAPDADVVSVDGRGGLPPSGTTDVLLDRTRDIVVEAANNLGTTRTTTGAIRVQPVPRIETIRLPEPPPFLAAAAPPVGVHGSRLDAVLARQVRERGVATGRGDA